MITIKLTADEVQLAVDAMSHAVVATTSEMDITDPDDERVAHSEEYRRWVRRLVTHASGDTKWLRLSRAEAQRLAWLMLDWGANLIKDGDAPEVVARRSGYEALSQRLTEASL